MERICSVLLNNYEISTVFTEMECDGTLLNIVKSINYAIVTQSNT